MTGRIYLYLARRDKKGIKVLNVFPNDGDFPHTRLKDVKSLNLPKNLETSLSKIIFQERMLWEPWIEGANSFKEFRTSLIKRGFTNVPLYVSPTYSQAKVIAQEKDKLNPTMPEKRTIKGMLRKRA